MIWERNNKPRQLKWKDSNEALVTEGWAGLRKKKKDGEACTDKHHRKMLPPSYIQGAQEGNCVNEMQVNWDSRRQSSRLGLMKGGTCPAMKEKKKKTSPTTSFVSFLLSSNLKFSLTAQEMGNCPSTGSWAEKCREWIQGGREQSAHKYNKVPLYLSKILC